MGDGGPHHPRDERVTPGVDGRDFPEGRWRARWVWSRPAPTTLLPSAEPVIDPASARSWVLLRRTVELDHVPERVPARATADSRYVLWVNGTEVARGPVRDHPQRLHVDLVDLAPHLRAGPNTIAVLARHYGEATPWWMPSTPTYGLGAGAFVFEADLGAGAPELPDGWLVTDARWRALEPPAWEALAASGIGAVPVERCDGRRLPAHWQDTAFDDTDWPAAHQLTTSHTGWPGSHHPPNHPYGPLRPRPLPQLTGEVRRGLITAVAIAPASGVGALDDPVAQAGADEESAVGRSGYRLLPTAEPTLTVDPATALDGSPAVVLLRVDLGEQVAGTVAIDLDAPEGTVVDAKAAEALGPDGRLEALQQHSGFRYTCRGHADRFETFDPIGLRHLVLAIRSSGPVSVRSVEVHERLFPRHTVTSRHPGDPTEVPTFACSDPLLDRIWTVGRRTVDLCSQDAYLDCPSREQRAWTGDAVVHQLVDLTTNVDWSLAVHNVVVGAAPRPDGMLPMAAAGDFAWLDRTIIPDWALHWIRSLRNVWDHTGDEELVEALLPVAERVLQWFAPFRQTDGLLHDVNGWVLVDWSAVSTAGASGAVNALYGRALRDVAAMSAGLGDEGRAARWDARHRDLVSAFEALWDEARGVYVDHIVDGERRRPVSQHTNAAALAAGLVPRERRAAVVEAMVDRDRLVHAAWMMPGREATLEGAGDMYAGFLYLVTGTAEPWWDVERQLVAAQPYYRYVVHDAVVEAGEADRIPDLCRDWAALLEDDTTTWRETWYGGSYCHAWCATPTRDLMQVVLGVRPGSPGFTRATIAPHLGDLAWARGAVPTPSGLLHVDIDGDRLELTTPVPADVLLPGAAAPVAVDPGTHTLPR